MNFKTTATQRDFLGGILGAHLFTHSCLIAREGSVVGGGLLQKGIRGTEWLRIGILGQYGEAEERNVLLGPQLIVFVTHIDGD